MNDFWNFYASDKVHIQRSQNATNMSSDLKLLAYISYVVIKCCAYAMPCSTLRLEVSHVHACASQM